MPPALVAGLAVDTADAAKEAAAQAETAVTAPAEAVQRARDAQSKGFPKTGT